MTPSPGPPMPYRITIRNFLGISLMIVLICVIGGIILVRLDPTLFTEARPTHENMLWFSLVFTFAVLAATGYVLATHGAQGWEVIGLTPPEPRWVLIGIATMAALFFAGERLDALLGFGILEGDRKSYAAALQSQVGLITLFAVKAVLLPVPLEIYFRGVFLNFVRGAVNLEVAIGLSTITYGFLFYHPDRPISVAYGIVHGAALSMLYVRSGSLWTSIAGNATLGALTVAKIAWG